MLTLKCKPRFIIATEEKCRQFNWYFRYLYMVMLWAAVTIKNTSVVKPTNVLRTAVTKLNTNDLINMSEMTQLVVKWFNQLWNDSTSCKMIRSIYVKWLNDSINATTLGPSAQINATTHLATTLGPSAKSRAACFLHSPCFQHQLDSDRFLRASIWCILSPWSCSLG